MRYMLDTKISGIYAIKEKAEESVSAITKHDPAEKYVFQQFTYEELNAWRGKKVKKRWKRNRLASVEYWANY